VGLPEYLRSGGRTTGQRRTPLTVEQFPEAREGVHLRVFRVECHHGDDLVGSFPDRDWVRDECLEEGARHDAKTGKVLLAPEFQERQDGRLQAGLCFRCLRHPGRLFAARAHKCAMRAKCRTSRVLASVILSPSHSLRVNSVGIQVVMFATDRLPLSEGPLVALAEPQPVLHCSHHGRCRLPRSTATDTELIDGHSLGFPTD